MIIQEVELSDFGSYEKLKLNLYDRGLILVEGVNLDDGGSNGAGKTTIFGGLSWTLFEDSLTKKSADGVIRLSQPDKEPIVGSTGGIVRLHSQGSEIEVHRYRKHKQWKNKLLLFIDGQEKSGSTNAHTQSMINEILQMDSELFKTIVLFPQRATGFAAGTDSGQKDILERILRAQRFSLARKRVNDKVAAISKSISVAEASTVMLLDRVYSAERDYLELTEKLDEYDFTWIRKIRKLRYHVYEMYRRIPEIDHILVDKLDECNKAIEASDKAVHNLDEINVLKETVDRKIGSLLIQKTYKDQELERFVKVGIPPVPPSKPDLPLAYYQSTLVDLDRSKTRMETELAGLESRIKRAESEIEKAQRVEKCPHCESPLTEESRICLFGDKKSDLDILSQNRQALIGTLAAHEKIIESTAGMAVTAAAWEVCDNVHKVQEQIATIATEKLQLEAQLKNLEEMSEAARNTVYAAMGARKTAEGVRQMLQVQKDAMHAWEADVDATESDIIKLLEETSPIEQMLESATTRILELKYQHRKQESYLIELRKQYQYLIYWVRGFGPAGVKGMLFDAVIPLLNERSGVHLAHLSGDNATVTFSTQFETLGGELRDKLNVQVEYKWGYNQYGGTSGGEQHRVDIATMFALGDLASSRAGESVKLRLMDEPFDDLDNIGKEKVFRLLRDEVTPSVGTLLVMSHDDRLSSMFDRRVTVVKERGVSRLEEN